LQVRQHHAKFRLHSFSQPEWFPLIDNLLNLDIRYYIFFEHWQVSLPRQIAIEKVYQNVNEALDVVLGACLDTLQRIIRGEVWRTAEFVLLGLAQRRTQTEINQEKLVIV
jgi:hypothetical protein